jgi:VWFA-related protein
MYDAIYEASRDKFLHSGDTDTVSVRRVLIVIGDGDDNNSRASREETLAMAQRAEATIFTIGTNISGVEMTGDKILHRFSEETGGRSFFPFHLQDMTTSFQNITLELRSQYSLVFRPTTPRDGQFHRIEVASLRKGVKVRARKGYFATSQ